VSWPTPPGTVITEGQLSAALSAQVQELAGAAARADGVAPLSEDVLLQVRSAARGDAPPYPALSARSEPVTDNAIVPAPPGQTIRPQSRDLVLTLADGTVAGFAHLDAPDEAQDGDASGELVVHPGHRGRGYGRALSDALIAGTGGAGVRLWAHGELPAALGLAKAAGYTRFRALWQMRMPLASLGSVPGSAAAAPPDVSIRTFRPGADEEAWLAVNGRAFAHHPEQGSWSRQDLLLREAEPWFDPDGFFLAERDGRLAGFHWTKVHPAGGTGGAPLGEVYVVGVDPGQQGGGLGRALTLAGLRHLRERGLGEVMLYVDEDNTAAVRMYAALGFSHWSTDAMYRHP
jgi:mycothiol synthase